MTDGDQSGSQSAEVNRVRGAGVVFAPTIVLSPSPTVYTVSSLSFQRKSKCPSMISLSRQRLLHSK